MSFKKTQAVEPSVPTYAFTHDGSCFPTEQVPDNLPSRAMAQLARKLREGDLRPDEMVLEISRQPQAVQRMFPIPVLAQWSGLSAYWQWPMAWSSNPAASYLKHRGAGVPLEGRDEGTWIERVLNARRRHNEPTPPQDVTSASALIGDVLGAHA